MKRLTAFLALTAIVFTAFGDEPVTRPNDELRDELLKRFKEDQDARKALIEWRQQQKQSPKPTDPVSPALTKVLEIDRANTKWLKEVIDKHGWPGVSSVGREGARAAWLLVQHADADREFQKKCLALMKAVKKGEIDPTNLAYLTDRVLVGEGKKQLYGTQFRTVGGKLEPSPIEDESKVDERRKEVGLGTLAEYRKQLEQTYGKPKK